MTVPGTTPHERSAQGSDPPLGLCACSPPSLPDDTGAKRRVDRLLRGPILWYFALVVALLVAAPLFATRVELLLVSLAALIGGGLCAVNFWRCRHAHCLVTGAGWLGLGMFTLVEAGLGHSLINGTESLVFLGIGVVGFTFEGVWYLARGTTALVRTAR